MPRICVFTGAWTNDGSVRPALRDRASIVAGGRLADVLRRVLLIVRKRRTLAKAVRG